MTFAPAVIASEAKQSRANRKGPSMDKFTKLTGVAAPLPMINIDTDKIFPAGYLKTIKRTGLARYLFDEIRFWPDGSENHDFVLYQEPYRTATIMAGYIHF